MTEINSQDFEKSIITCNIRCISKGFVFRMHRHDHIEMEIILSGEAEHICNSELTRVSKGHAYIITPSGHHAFNAMSDVKLLNVLFDANILDKDIRDVLSAVTDKNFCCVFKDSLLKEMSEKVYRIKREQSDRTLLSDAVSKAMLCEIVSEIIRKSENNLSVVPSLARNAVSYVHANFKNPITVTDLANTFSVTPNYMGKVFKLHTGLSFNSYLNSIRLKYACNMLKFSEIAINETAVMAGYSSVEYFFYIFKQHMGMTPKEYRASKIKQGTD